MTTHLAAYDLATGRILAIASASRPEVAEANLPPQPGEGRATVTAQTTMATHYIVTATGEALPRPSLPDLAPLSGPAPLEIALDALPPGALVMARNEAGDVLELTDLGEPLALVDPGLYWVSIVPPFPWRGADLVIEVGNA